MRAKHLIVLIGTLFATAAFAQLSPHTVGSGIHTLTVSPGDATVIADSWDDVYCVDVPSPGGPARYRQATVYLKIDGVTVQSLTVTDLPLSDPVIPNVGPFHYAGTLTSGYHNIEFTLFSSSGTYAGSGPPIASYTWTVTWSGYIP